MLYHAQTNISLYFTVVNRMGLSVEGFPEVSMQIDILCQDTARDFLFLWYDVQVICYVTWCIRYNCGII